MRGVNVMDDEKKKVEKNEELSLDELEAVSGGADRDWLTDGCAATVEPGSWCRSDDSCYEWDVEYLHEPEKVCVCGGYMYNSRSTNDYYYYKCIVCQKTIREEREHPGGTPKD
jgi:hypothetical protein